MSIIGYPVRVVSKSALFYPLTISMIYRSLSLTALALVAALFTSCGSSSPNVISKSAIKSGASRTVYAKRESFAIPAASTTAVAASSGKPRDKHSMPVYAFADRNRIVRTTAYTCSEDDHLIYGSKNATGTQLRYTDKVRSAAADWSFYPVGTTFRIKGLPYLYVVDDYGSALTGTGTVDIYKPSKEIMNQWGRRNVELTIVQWGSFNRSAELLSQRTGYSHCRSMLANIRRQQSSSTTGVAKL
jgi:3D (Asp-Asp-Asp) domain-containing protein